MIFHLLEEAVLLQFSSAFEIRPVCTNRLYWKNTVSFHQGKTRCFLLIIKEFKGLILITTLFFLFLSCASRDRTGENGHANQSTVLQSENKCPLSVWSSWIIKQHFWQHLFYYWNNLNKTWKKLRWASDLKCWQLCSTFLLIFTAQRCHAGFSAGTVHHPWQEWSIICSIQGRRNIWRFYASVKM